MTTQSGQARPGAAFRHAVFAVKQQTVLRRSDRLARRAATDEAVPVERLLARQRQAAVDHARFAMANSPFYRRFYGDAGFTLDDLRDPDVFAALPIVEKDHVRAHFDDFRTPEATPRTSTLGRSRIATPSVVGGRSQVRSAVPRAWCGGNASYRQAE